MASAEERKSKRKRKGTEADRLVITPGKYMLERTLPDLKGIAAIDELAFDEVGPYICAGGWTASVFKRGSTKKKFFVGHGGVLVLDFDEKLTLDEAKKRFEGFRHIIGLTKSHQKPKNIGLRSEKPPCDRFRVLLFSERSAESVAELEATNRSVFEWNAEADKTCLHASKVWSPCTKIVVEQIEGALVPISVPPPATTGTTGKSKDSKLEPLPLVSFPSVQGNNQYQQGKAYQAAAGFLCATRPSISGDRGHDRLFRAACTVIKEFMIEDEDAAVDLIFQHFNPRCEPPWSMGEIRHKVRDAKKTKTHVYGHGVNKPWDIRWRCCPALVSLLDRLGRNEEIDRALYAPGIEEHARVALKRRWISTKTSKKRVDGWCFDLGVFLI